MDDALLREGYFQRAAAWHPDAPEGDAEKFRTLQEAHRILRNPASRLRHLLDLQDGEPPAAGPPVCPDVFLETSAVLQQARALAPRLDAARSPLARALLAGEHSATNRRIAAALATVDERLDEANASLSRLDAAWPDVAAADLAALAAQFGFLIRWRTELAEWKFRLAQ